MIKDPKVTLLYPPIQTWEGFQCKPNGSLAYPYLAAALMRHGVDVEIFDASVGEGEDDLDAIFASPILLPTGMYRTGVSDERMLSRLKDSTVVGITSIFSEQESIVLETIRKIRRTYPEKYIICGGVK